MIARILWQSAAEAAKSKKGKDLSITQGNVYEPSIK